MDLSNVTFADIRRIEREYGVVLGMDENAVILTDEARQAFDAQITAQPGLVTTPSGAIPWYLTNYFDPKMIEVIFARMKAVDILGEAKKGDWTTSTAMFLLAEMTGEVSSYGDFNENGSSGINVNFPQRQSYHYQTMTQWGEKQQDQYGLAKVDYASNINRSSIEILNRYQNQTYFFGVANLQNYGLLNDPNLSASLTPGTKTAGNGNVWVYNGAINATANEVYTDILNMFIELQTQSDGVITYDSPLVLSLSPVSSGALLAVNAPYNTVNLYDMLKKSFPNLRVEIAVQYASGVSGFSGNLVQLIATEVNGPNGRQQTATCAFTEKLRAHKIIPTSSGFKQKKSQGSFGAVIWQPFAIASMIGV